MERLESLIRPRDDEFSMSDRHLRANRQRVAALSPLVPEKYVWVSPSFSPVSVFAGDAKEPRLGHLSER